MRFTTSIITNIEMKTGVFEYLEMEQMLVDMLREYKVEDRVLITSFNLEGQDGVLWILAAKATMGVVFDHDRRDPL